MTRTTATALRHLVLQQHMKGFELSLSDKLFDDEPYTPIPTVLHQLSFKEFKSAVTRDIESLFNTRIVLEEEDLHGLPGCKRSLLAYGLNDSSSLSLASFYDRSYICQSLTKATERHEPRLQHMNASLEISERTTNALCFEISAVLLVEPVRGPVSFGTMLQPSTL